MRTVKLRLPASLRELAGGAASVDLDVPMPATVADVLDHLASLHPELERRVRDEQGVVRTHVNVFVGPLNIRDLDGQATPVAGGADVTVLPAISGGGCP
jgi:molybdopterin synthase sulfur carrier subunit